MSRNKMVPVHDDEKDTRKRSRYRSCSTSHFVVVGGWGRGLFEGTFNVVIDWGLEQTWIPPAFHTTDALPIVCNDAIVP